MKATVTWQDGLKMLGKTGSGHSLLLDGDGPGVAASPMEALLIAAGSCSSIDVVSILQKARQDITGCRVEIQSERAESVPRIFEKIHLHFIVSGHDLSEKQVTRAVELSMQKYCSVSLMLAKAMEIDHSYAIESAIPAA